MPKAGDDPSPAFLLFWLLMTVGCYAAVADGIASTA